MGVIGMVFLHLVHLHITFAIAAELKS